MHVAHATIGPRSDERELGASSSQGRRTPLENQVDITSGVCTIPVGPWQTSHAFSRPNAPVTYNQGRVRPSWFDIANLPPCNHYDETGVSASVAYLEHLIITEVREGSVPESRIVLVGFSQGASLSLTTALTTLHELGGVASLSGWIPQQCRQVKSPVTLICSHIC